METASAQYHNPRPLPEEQQRFEPSASEVAGVLARPSSLFDGPLAEKVSLSQRNGSEDMRMRCPSGPRLTSLRGRIADGFPL